MKKTILLMFLLLLCLTQYAQNVQIEVNPSTIKFLPGAPALFEVKITNLGDKEIPIAGKRLSDGISVSGVVLKKESGEKLQCNSQEEQSSYFKGEPDTPIKDVIYLKAGEVYRVSTGVYEEKGCPIEKDVSGIWDGEITVTIKVAEGPLVKDVSDKKFSAKVRVEIEKPQGEDLAYINAVRKWLKEADPKEIKGYTAEVRPLTWGELLNSFRIPVNQILLSKFPTSTYAAYVIYGRLGNFAYADFTDSKFIRSIETQSILSNSCPTEAGWIWMKGEMNAAWWEKWVNLILKNHPDIWFADELKLRLAVNEIALKRYESGESALEKLAKEGKPNVAERAKELLKVMEEKGWSKKSNATKEIQLPSSKEAKQ